MTKRKYLKDVAYEKIKEMLLKDELVDYTSENTLVKELNMSRTPIREALHRLEQDGLLKIIPNQGIVLTKLTPNQKNEIVDMRIAIETFTLKKVVNLIKEEDFKNLDLIIAKQLEAIAKPDFYLFAKADSEFHEYLLSIVGNTYFLKMFRDAYEYRFSLSEYKSALNNDTELVNEFINEHREILALLKKRDIEQAAEQLEKHIDRGRYRIYQ